MRAIRLEFARRQQLGQLMTRPPTHGHCLECGYPLPPRKQWRWALCEPCLIALERERTAALCEPSIGRCRGCSAVIPVGQSDCDECERGDERERETRRPAQLEREGERMQGRLFEPTGLDCG